MKTKYIDVEKCEVNTKPIFGQKFMNKLIWGNEGGFTKVKITPKKYPDLFTSEKEQEINEEI